MSPVYSQVAERNEGPYRRTEAESVLDNGAKLSVGGDSARALGLLPRHSPPARHPPSTHRPHLAVELLQLSDGVLLDKVDEEKDLLGIHPVR